MKYLPATLNLTFYCCAYACTAQIILFTSLAMPWPVICGTVMGWITVIASPTATEPPINLIRVCPVQRVSMQWSNVRLEAVKTHIKIAFITMTGKSERVQATSYIDQFQYDVKFHVMWIVTSYVWFHYHITFQVIIAENNKGWLFSEFDNIHSRVNKIKVFLYSTGMAKKFN